MLDLPKATPEGRKPKDLLDACQKDGGLKGVEQGGKKGVLIDEEKLARHADGAEGQPDIPLPRQRRWCPGSMCLKNTSR